MDWLDRDRLLRSARCTCRRPSMSFGVMSARVSTSCPMHAQALCNHEHARVVVRDVTADRVRLTMLCPRCGFDWHELGRARLPGLWRLDAGRYG